MLCRFKVQNFLSFKDSSTLDMEAEGLKDKKNYIHVPYLHNPKLNLLKSCVIYGYNAYGKSNLLKAYTLYRRLILQSFSMGINNSNLAVEPFLLNTTTSQQPTTFESEFIIKATKYKYGFEILRNKIESEWLYYADGPVRWNPLFVRAGQDFRELSKLWNKGTQNKVEQAKFFTKPQNLFLTVLLSQEAIPRIDEIGNWFKGNMVLNGNYSSVLNSGASDIYNKEEYRSTILKFLDSADIGFKSVFEKISRYTDQGHNPALLDFLFEPAKSNFDLYTQHQVYDNEYHVQKLIEFELSKNESSGSIKYFIIACFLAYAIKNGQLIWIDEIDASLHSQLLLFIIQVFNSEKNNTSGAQLVFTSHNTVMLDNKLRRDQIWFVDKNEYGESKLVKGHTVETPIRINKSIEQEYRSGKIKKGTSRKINPSSLPSLFEDTEKDPVD